MGATRPVTARDVPLESWREVVRMLWRIRHDLLALNDKALERPIVHARMPGLEVYLVYLADHVQHVLSGRRQGNYSKGQDYELLATALGLGLLTSSGKLWRRQRNRVQPLFAQRHVDRFVPAMTAAGAAMLARWERHPADKSIDIADAMAELTLDVIGRALFSADLMESESATIRKTVSEIVTELSRAARSPLLWAASTFPGMSLARAHALRPWSRWRFRRRLRELDAIVARTIALRRAAGATGESKDLLDLLLESDEETGERMGDRQLRDEIVTFLFAGHETTAIGLTWMWWLLAGASTARERMQAEVDEVLGGRIPTYADVERLPWTRAVVMETLRRYPPLWILLRDVEEDDVIGDARIRAGTTVIVLPRLTHHDPNAWAAPRTFDPSRFLDHSYRRDAYIPFSTGKRQCVGRAFALTEAIVLAAMITQRFELDVDPAHQVEPDAVLTLRPRDGMKMRLRRREMEDRTQTTAMEE